MVVKRREEPSSARQYEPGAPMTAVAVVVARVMSIRPPGYAPWGWEGARGEGRDKANNSGLKRSAEGYISPGLLQGMWLVQAMKRDQTREPHRRLWRVARAATSATLALCAATRHGQPRRRRATSLPAAAARPTASVEIWALPRPPLGHCMGEGEAAHVSQGGSVARRVGHKLVWDVRPVWRFLCGHGRQQPRGDGEIRVGPICMGLGGRRSAHPAALAKLGHRQIASASDLRLSPAVPLVTLPEDWSKLMAAYKMEVGFH